MVSAENKIINVIILHYKTIDKTIDCISSILETELDAHVCIIDNYSNNGTLETLKSKYSNDKRISFICLDENKGYARANNAGMRFLYENGARYAIVTNNDVVFSPESIISLINALRATGSILAAPKVNNPEGQTMNSVQLYRCHNIFEYLYRKIFSILLGNRVNFARDCQYITQIKSFSGSCFACDLEKMHEIDYFDEYTFLYFEEPILSLKIEKAGYNMVFVPKAEVIHYHGATTKNSSLFAEACKLESQIYYLNNYLNCNKYILACYVYLKRNRDWRRYHSDKLYKKETEMLHLLIS